jgi:16S rRNA (adenine1518-N6/adenine1519-N6)-dimethyltransferase
VSGAAGWCARAAAAAFGQRRKTLRNALASIAGEASLRAAGVDPAARGETLAVADFVRLANVLAAPRAGIAGTAAVPGR